MAESSSLDPLSIPFNTVGKGSMATSSPEWLLWCTRLKMEHTEIFDQLSSLTQAISQTEGLVSKVTKLTTSNECLQAQNDSLKDRIIDLDKGTKEHDDFKISTLQAHEHFQAENDVLKDRMLLLEQDANQQDQINAVSSQAKAALEGKIETLKREFISVTDAVRTMLSTVRMERQMQKNELQDLRARMDALVGSRPQRYGDDDALDGLFPASSPSPRKAMIEAAPAENLKGTRFLDNMQSGPRDFGATQLHTQHLNASQPEITDAQTVIAVQGSLSLEEYISHYETVLSEDASHEAQKVYDFVIGLKNEDQQRRLKERLDKEGWIWLKAKKEVRRLAENTRRLRKRRRVMPADVYDGQP